MARVDHILPKAEKALAQMGENIKLARRRRKISTDQLAERAGISRPTLWSIEIYTVQVRVLAEIKMGPSDSISKSPMKLPQAVISSNHFLHDLKLLATMLSA